MSDCKLVSVPLETHVEFSNEIIDCNKNIPYQQLIGSLMYLAVLTRPDIAYSVSFISQFNNNFNDSHWKCAKRILKYFKHTRHHGLVYRKSDLTLEGFVDADWGNDKTDRKSYTGFVFKLSEGAISWESRKQKTVALSSTEAEYMAISEAAKEAIYFRNFIFEITGRLHKVSLYNDNLSAQKLAINPVFHKRSKHIDIRHHFIRETVHDGTISLLYLPTDEMIADILTKSLVSPSC